MNTKKLHLVRTLAFTALIAGTLVSCAPSVKIDIANDNSAKMEFSTSLSKSIEGSIRSLMGLQNDEPLYKEAPVRASLIATGLDVESINFPSMTGIEIKAGIKNINTSLTYAKDAVRVVSKGSGKEATIQFSPQIITEALNFMPEETRTYADLLMAPVFTGETMTADEYLFLLSMVYGETLANELAKSSFFVELSAPSDIKQASLSDTSLGTVSISGKKAIFTISLYKLLSTSGKTEYLVSW